MRNRDRVVVVLAALALVGCSRGGDAGNIAATDSAGSQARTRTFFVPGGANSVSLYGREASPAERKQASRVIKRWMRARAAKDFVEECRYFSRRYIEVLVVEDAERVSGGKVKTCPRALAYFGSSASGNFEDTLTGPIDSLRVPGPPLSDRPPSPAEPHLGFAQYHGKGGVDYQIPMHRERGRWWVAIAAPVEQEG